MDYVISSDPNWVDVDVVWRFLSEESYWARGIPRETVLRSLPHSILFGVYETGPQSGREQVGFARVISDRGDVRLLGRCFHFWRIIAIRDCPSVCCKLFWRTQSFGDYGVGCFSRQMHTRSTNNLVSRARRIPNESWRSDGRMLVMSNR